jgi:hypothetical protein
MRLLALLMAALLCLPVSAKIHRSQSARHAFVRDHACPSTHENRLPCPGYVIDHIQALCVGGVDDPINMQWQTTKAAKDKDRWECKAGWETHLK